MVVEIQCCVNSINQHIKHPSSTPESSGPLKKYYLVSRDFLRGKKLYPELYLDPGSSGGNTTSTGPKSLVPREGSWLETGL